MFTKTGNKVIKRQKVQTANQDKVLSENNVPKTNKYVKSSGIIATRRPVLNDISCNLHVKQNDNQKEKITRQPSNVVFSKPYPRLTSNTTSITKKIKPHGNQTRINNATPCNVAKLIPLSYTSKTTLNVNENILNISNILKTVHRPNAVFKPYKGTLTGNSSLHRKSNQDKVLSENNVPKTYKHVKSSGIIATRRPVLNDISSNLQVKRNDNQIAKKKPYPRLTSNSNHTTTSITKKVEPHGNQTRLNNATTCNMTMPLSHTS